MRVMLLAWCFSSAKINSHSSFFLLFSCFVVWLFCCLVVLLSGCFVDCIVYTFNKITKPLNNKTTILNIDILHFPTAVGTEGLFIACESWIKQVINDNLITCFIP